MAKIVGSIGKYVKQDRATLAREKLQYARVLIEVSFTKELPNQIKFEDENGEYVYVEVHYEWKPDVCMHCRGIGHRQELCKKKGPQGASSKIWQEKKKEDLNSDLRQSGKLVIPDKGDPVITSGVVQQNRGQQGIMAKNKGITESNSFSLLGQFSDTEVQAGVVLQEMRSNMNGGGEPPFTNG
ncbi:uncharacterized protein LOC133791315 [Humulus lupulus]|uniref:uncharacterized protein LOC133791315 n=1 Tax=Humulus lupulus TaxID=3486 RepID=UPI002B40920E|nr:uncharacterized protein LOC133791315 [Humulus lupulus]